MIAKGDIRDIREGRKIVRQSFEIKSYKPQQGNWKAVIDRYKKTLLETAK